ncbi:MAG TPA: hypothetical protein VFU14_20325 [Acidimicrobiales bacterium]|nr:hypothetical protein [Acidimicrobiales bacterium]
MPPAPVPSKPRPVDVHDGDNVRFADPDTSREAARTVDVHRSEDCKQVMAAVVEIHRTNWGHGATAHDIVMRLAYTGLAPAQNVVAARCTDLHRAGKLADTGDRRVGGSNRRLIVWAPTEAGRELADGVELRGNAPEGGDAA